MDAAAHLDRYARAKVEAEQRRGLAENLLRQADEADDPHQAKLWRGQAGEAFLRAARREQDAARYLDAWRKSQPITEKGANEKTEAELTAKAEDKMRRAWFLPGSVAADPMLQLDEAGRGGLLEQTAKYAGRSIFDAYRHGFDPNSIGACVGRAFKEGLRPVGVQDHVDRQAESLAASRSRAERTEPPDRKTAKPEPLKGHHHGPPGVDPSEGSLFSWFTKADAELSGPVPSLFDVLGLTEDDPQAEKTAPTEEIDPEMEPDL